MCDYSLECVAARAAVVADQLVTANFPTTFTQALLLSAIPARPFAWARAPKSLLIGSRDTHDSQDFGDERHAARSRGFAKWTSKSPRFTTTP
jgi:hypothetical protein